MRSGTRASVEDQTFLPSKSKPGIEEVRDHMDQIRNPEGYAVPGSIGDEMKLLMESFKD